MKDTLLEVLDIDVERDIDEDDDIDFALSEMAQEAGETMVHGPRALADGRPDPQWIRGTCPECGDDLVSNLYYVGGKGYLLVWECWSGLGERPSCCYRRVL